MVHSELKSSIRREAALRRENTADDIIRRITASDITGATGDLIFHTRPESFTAKLDRVLAALKHESDPESVGFLVKLAIDLKSYLVEWNLKPTLSQDAVEAATAKVLDLLESVEGRENGISAEFRTQISREHVARITTEGVDDLNLAMAEAEELLGNGLCDYAKNMGRLIGGSNLYRVCLSPDIPTEIGNDYAVFLQHVIWMGATFCTTNPVLIKLAWDTDPEYWNERVDRIIRSVVVDETAVSTVNSKLTMAVVLENCRLLRDIFLITEGRQGYVSLQINPVAHEDAGQMVAEARGLYRELSEELDGVPNVVIKLPSTAPGLEAAELLTADGIGVTITLTFSVFQACGFAEVLQRGNQLVSYIAIMNGRMAFPVRDELAQIEGGADAARWAGVAVARKATAALYSPDHGSGVDADRVRIMIASLRIYDDGRAGGWIPDVSELWGIPLITVFPNVRRAFDSVPREARSATVDDALPDGVLAILNLSTIFRQAWWVPGDRESERPETVIGLDEGDSALLTQWQPVSDTLTQFIDYYRQMGQLVAGRIKALGL